jgi:hypothetical protein
MSYRLVVYRGKEGLSKIAEFWMRMVETIRNRHLGHSYYYYLSCLDALGSKAQDISFHTLWKDDQLRAIIPLQLSTRKFSGVRTRVLESPTTIYLPFYDIIGDDSDIELNATAVFFELLKRCSDVRWDVLLLKGVPEGSRVARELKTSKAWYLSRRAAHSDYLTCQPFEEYKLVLSKNFRGNLRKARNKLNARNDVHYVCYRDKNQLSSALSRFVALEARGWKGQVGGAIAQRPEMNRYYESLVNIFSSEPRGECEINELWVEGVLAASQICVRLDETVYVLKVAYREELANLAPGNLLLAWLIHRCAVEDGVRYLNLVSDTKWHSDWEPKTMERWDFELYRSPLRRNMVQLLRYVKANLAKRRLSKQKLREYLQEPLSTYKPISEPLQKYHSLPRRR